MEPSELEKQVENLIEPIMKEIRDDESKCLICVCGDTNVGTCTLLGTGYDHNITSVLVTLCMGNPDFHKALVGALSIVEREKAIQDIWKNSKAN